ncbi:hypothetical protein M440DRAFT_98033 [Trichoderma longibrachiatum ATCC 18648]|uniref:Uncharacterized protein n=1 Tax=Trichoderma longibrachiatum ATCC 18648 TaxID=983965 RepID=A0A2T4BZ14_TRILO|nr:hypothetical protein M440DRAFT_98033 [Trichoderma longibrachiatum ATCC 18648]
MTDDAFPCVSTPDRHHTPHIATDSYDFDLTRFTPSIILIILNPHHRPLSCSPEIKATPLERPCKSSLLAPRASERRRRGSLASRRKAGQKGRQMTAHQMRGGRGEGGLLAFVPLPLLHSLVDITCCHVTVCNANSCLSLITAITTGSSLPSLGEHHHRDSTTKPSFLSATSFPKRGRLKGPVACI